MQSEPRPLKKILVIEDSPDLCSFIAEALNANGFQALRAEDGAQGVMMATKHLPDLILCDLQMPKLDGYGTLTLLREHPATRRIPFIFLTGAFDKVLPRQGLELNAPDYLNKPFKLSELLCRIKARMREETCAGGKPQFEALAPSNRIFN
jgi:two-component system, sensor histidine kinase and response regulator